MGQDKATLRINGQSLLERTVSVLASVTDELFVVGRKSLSPPAPAATAIPDDTSSAGPLGGLVTGLRQSHHTYAVVVACDLPFLDAELLRHLLHLAPGYDAVVPRIDGRAQVLHAVYARRVERAAREQIAAGQLKVERVLERLRVRWIEAAEIKPIDPLHRSFINVNTPEDWKRAVELSRAERTAGRVSAG